MRAPSLRVVCRTNVVRVRRDPEVVAAEQRAAAIAKTKYDMEQVYFVVIEGGRIISRGLKARWDALKTVTDFEKHMDKPGWTYEVLTKEEYKKRRG